MASDKGPEVKTESEPTTPTVQTKFKPQQTLPGWLVGIKEVRYPPKFKESEPSGRGTMGDESTSLSEKGTKMDSMEPFEGLMIVGYEIQYAGFSGGSTSGAMTASVTDKLNRYYSLSARQVNDKSIEPLLSQLIFRCLEVYKNYNNGGIPKRVLIYRNGGEQGQLEMIFLQELKALEKIINRMSHNQETRSNLTYIVINKKANAKFGTGLDGLKFHLEGKELGQADGSRVYYDVLRDDGGCSQEQLQSMTQKFCEEFFKWTGKTEAPVSCQLTTNIFNPK